MQEIQETWVWSLGQEDPVEGVMAAHSSILAWKIPWTEEPGELQSTASQRAGHDWSELARMDVQYKVFGEPTENCMDHLSSQDLGKWPLQKAGLQGLQGGSSRLPSCFPIVGLSLRKLCKCQWLFLISCKTAYWGDRLPLYWDDG